MASKYKKESITELYNEKTVALSNALAQARKKTDVLESKLEILAIYKMQEGLNSRIKKDASGNAYTVHYVQIYTKEVKLLSDRKGGSIYERMAEVAISLSNKKMIIMRPDDDFFSVTHLYGDVTYDDGVLDIEFNPSNEELFLNMSNEFVKLRLDICFIFKTIGGLQLYKILKSNCYDLDEFIPGTPQELLPKKVYQITLAELRLQTGYVDLEAPGVEREAVKGKPNNEKLAQKEKSAKYTRFNNFYSCVIKKGIEEINAISDIYICDVEKINGPHAKVIALRFTVQRNAAYEELHPSKKRKKEVLIEIKKQDKKVPIAATVDVDSFIDEMQEIIKTEERIKIKDLKAIAKAADYDIEKIKKANEVLQESFNIKNVVGWLIEAIKNDYKPSKGKNDKKNNKQSKNSFNNFPQREYTSEQIAEMEKQLLNRPFDQAV